MLMESFEVKIRAVTPIWTGGADGKGDKLHNTGIIGSLRWWYEAIVRGLGGYACDPGDPTADKCKFDNTESGIDKLDKELHLKICPVCNLFGCTGWQRRFRFEIRNDDDGCPGTIKTKAIDEKDPKEKEFWLRFVGLKPIEPSEKALLRAVLLISSQYGAIGGKTVFKPSEIPDKNKTKKHHHDFGLFQVISDTNAYTISRDEVEKYLKKFIINKSNNLLWPDLRYFWFAPGTLLHRQMHNHLVHRSSHDPKIYENKQASEGHRWLGGETRVSKRIFSFHTAGTVRTWGYLKNDESRAGLLKDILNEMNLKENEIKTGEEILNELFQ